MVEPVPSSAAEDEPERPDPDESAEDGAKGKRRRRKPRKQRSFWVELPILIVVALVLAFVFQQFLARVYTIPSGSMETTLHGCTGCYGDKVLVDKITYDFTDPEPGDVVVFKGPEPWVENEVATQRSDNAVVRFFQNIGSVFGLAPPDERDFVKRIVATSGQTVQCCDAQNRVVVDGKALDEPYIHWENPEDDRQMSFDPVTVPDGYVWVMGDNRNDSCDSRCQGGGGVRGAVPVDNIIGKARIIVLPPGRWGGVSDHNPQADAQPVALSMSAPSWQEGVPLGFGFAAAWPVVWGGRRLGSKVREAVERKR
ncbi:signal peptidase I [Amycolatopsis endophytica]|uniref:Signal peptidase I n=1 Tax=Amycolatopsis endophytica TaxID=860233 RepID=A0A853AW76_9PSEU|nr:signal peptidase I [Amycolatopsis endophytica]NYI86874.1 signal peptidase I [Amycolatopsis endophytica]